MVGVAGKSRACQNCRRRRVECDLQRPCCARCIKANIVCTGYGREVVFVNRHPTSMTTTATTVLSDKRRQQLQYQSLDGYHANLHGRSSIIPEGQTFPRCPSSIEGRTRIVQLLKQIYLPRGFADDGVNGLQTCYSWLLEIDELTGASQSLDVALHSLYMSQLYATGSDAASLEACLDVYNTALQNLRADLEDPEAKLRDETLAAIVVISTNELFLNPVDNAWEAHTGGISEILKLRSSLKAGDSVRPNLCSRLHTICVVNALIKRRSLILTNQDWRRLKYTNNHCGNAYELDELIDIVGEVPALLEEAEALFKQSRISNPAAPLLWDTSLIQSYASIAQRLYTWQEQLKGIYSDAPLYWAMPSSLSYSPESEARDAENLFPLILHFRSLNVAIPLILSWAVLVQIYCSLSRIYEVIEQNPSSGSDQSCGVGIGVDIPEIPRNDTTGNPFNNNNFNNNNNPPTNENENSLSSSNQQSTINNNPPLPLSLEQQPCCWPTKSFCITEGHKLVRLLCQSIEYCHQIDNGTLGPQAVTYPQWIMRRYFRFRPGYERELRWCREFRGMIGLGFRCGIRVMNFGGDYMGYEV